MSGIAGKGVFFGKRLGKRDDLTSDRTDKDPSRRAIGDGDEITFRVLLGKAEFFEYLRSRALSNFGQSDQ